MATDFHVLLHLDGNTNVAVLIQSTLYIRSLLKSGGVFRQICVIESTITVLNIRRGAHSNKYLIIRRDEGLT